MSYVNLPNVIQSCFSTQENAWELGQNKAQSLSIHNQSSTLEEGMSSIPPGPTLFRPSNTTQVFNTDLDIPIVIQTGVRNYTQHPRCNFVFFFSF